MSQDFPILGRFLAGIGENQRFFIFHAIVGELKALVDVEGLLVFFETFRKVFVDLAALKGNSLYLLGLC